MSFSVKLYQKKSEIIMCSSTQNDDIFLLELKKVHVCGEWSVA